MACVVSPGWPDYSSGSSSQLPDLRRRAGEVTLERPQPRSGEDERAGRRRTADDHGQRGRSFRAGLSGVVLIPGVAGGVVSQAPIRRPAGGAGAMTMCPGTGLLSQMIERGLAAGSCRLASVPGA